MPLGALAYRQSLKIGHKAEPMVLLQAVPEQAPLAGVFDQLQPRVVPHPGSRDPQRNALS